MLKTKGRAKFFFFLLPKYIFFLFYFFFKIDFFYTEKKSVKRPSLGLVQTKKKKLENDFFFFKLSTRVCVCVKCFYTDIDRNNHWINFIFLYLLYLLPDQDLFYICRRKSKRIFPPSLLSQEFYIPKKIKIKKLVRSTTTAIIIPYTILRFKKDLFTIQKDLEEDFYYPLQTTTTTTSLTAVVLHHFHHEGI